MDVGGCPSAPVVANDDFTNRDSPPSSVMAASSNSVNAPVACNEDDQVLPMLTTSGPFPEVTADVIREYRSFHGTTSTVTLTPLAALNFSSSGFRMAASSSRLAAWLVAHQVISLLSELAAPALEPELLEPDEPHAVRAVAARTAAAAAISRLVCFIYSNLL